MAVKLMGHPVHQMLIVFPLGLLGGAVTFDLIALVLGSSAWFSAAYYMIIGGVIGGLVAAPFGLIDWIGIPSATRAKSIGAVHGLGNVLVIGLFAMSWFLRAPDPLSPNAASFVPSFFGLGLALITGWLGGELVDRLGVGVDEGANVNAPSSLSGRSARLT